MTDLIKLWKDGKWGEVEITALTNEDLIGEFAEEYWADDRSGTSDPPSRTNDLRQELLRRLTRG